MPKAREGAQKVIFGGHRANVIKNAAELQHTKPPQLHCSLCATFLPALGCGAREFFRLSACWTC